MNADVLQFAGQLIFYCVGKMSRLPGSIAANISLENKIGVAFGFRELFRYDLKSKNHLGRFDMSAIIVRIPWIIRDRNIAATGMNDLIP